MRLLITTDTVGGVWSFTADLVQGLLQRGHTVHLVSFGREPSAEQRAVVERLQQGCADGALLGWTPTAVPLEWMQPNEQALSAGGAVLERVQAHFRAEVLLSNQFCFGALQLGCPSVVVAHSDVLSWARACRPEGLPSSPWLDRYIALVRDGLHGASTVVAPSFTMAQDLVNSFPVPHGVTVVPNGAVVEAVSEPPQRRLQAITAGRFWDEAKGLAIMREIDPAMPVLVAGEAAPEGFSEGALPSSGSLEFLGALSRPALHQRFRESALYVCPSLYEPFGLAPLEAALCGCALLLRDLPSLREIWTEHALFFHDAPSLAQALRRLREEPALLAHMQASALEQAQDYNADRMTDNYLDLMTTLAHRPRDVSHAA